MEKKEKIKRKKTSNNKQHTKIKQILRDLVDITMKKMDHDKDGRASLSDFREMASTLSSTPSRKLSIIEAKCHYHFCKNSMAFANFYLLD